MKMVKRALAMLLIAAIALSFTACSDTTWAFEDNGQKYPAGVYLCQLLNAYSTASSKVEDSSKNILKQEIDGQSASDWIVQEADRLVKEFLYVEREFANRQLELTEDDKLSVQNQLAYQWQYLESAYEKNGVAKSSLELVLTNTMKRQAIFKDIYGEGGAQEVSEADLKTAFEEEYLKTRMITFSKKSSSGSELTESELSELETLARSYFDRAKNGEDMEKLIVERETELAEANDTELSHDHSEVTDHAGILNYEDSTMTDEVKEKFQNAKNDEILYIDDEAYIIVAQKQDILADSEDFDEYRDTVLNLLKGEEFDQMITEQIASLTPSYNSAALSRYTPKNLKL